MTEGIGRQQMNDVASLTTEVQDRSIYITGGGIWTWTQSTGTLAWTSTITIRIPGLTNHTVSTSSVASVSSAGDGIYLDLDRSSGGSGSLVKGTITDAASEDEDRLYIAVRGADNRLYMCDGTVFSDGESKSLGTVLGKTDKDTFTTDGRGTAYTLGFTYVSGTDQLIVFENGSLQRVITDYTEGGGTTNQITMVGSPTGTDVVCYNLVGGQGPAGVVNDLQEAIDADADVQMALGSPVRLYMLDGVGTDDSVILEGGSQSDQDAFQLLKGGIVVAYELRLVDRTTAKQWQLFSQGSDLIIRSTDNDNAIRIESAADGGLDFGSHNGTVFSSGEGELRWKEFTGSFHATLVTTIAHGLTSTKIKGAVLRANNTTSGVDQLGEMSLGVYASRGVFISMDTTNVYLSGDSAGADVVGADLQGEDYTLVIFYGN